MGAGVGSVCEACVVGGRFIGFGRDRAVRSGSGGAGQLTSQSGPSGRAGRRRAWRAGPGTAMMDWAAWAPPAVGVRE